MIIPLFVYEIHHYSLCSSSSGYEIEYCKHSIYTLFIRNLMPNKRLLEKNDLWRLVKVIFASTTGMLSFYLVYLNLKELYYHNTRQTTAKICLPLYHISKNCHTDNIFTKLTYTYEVICDQPLAINHFIRFQFYWETKSLV